MNMLLTTIILFVGFGAFIVIGGRLFVKLFPPSAEDIKRFNAEPEEFEIDDDYGTKEGVGANIDNDIGGGIWNA